MEVWASRLPEAGTIERQAERAEQQGWDGITLTDSQNLIGDPFVAAALGSRVTERLRFGTGVTNLFTRHPALLAGTAVTVQVETGGRFVLGVGRGDTALFHLGHKPQPVAEFGERLHRLQVYLRGDGVDCDGFDSRLRWLDRVDQPKVPVDLAPSGPRMIDLAAREAEYVTFALGADPERLSWGLELARKAAADAGRDPGEITFGAYVNVGLHADPDTARSMIAGGVAAFAHFSAMPGSTGAGLEGGDRAIVAEVGRRYDSHHHLNNAADHTAPLDADFIDRFGVVGPPERCIERVLDLAALGLERFVLIGPTFGADRDDTRNAHELLATEVLPVLKEPVT
jgi:5,10-methylenetetrahydromethanopterin reductase